jgi:hypothetical protein
MLIDSFQTDVRASLKVALALVLKSPVRNFLFT